MITSDIKQLLEFTLIYTVVPEVEMQFHWGSRSTSGTDDDDDEDWSSWGLFNSIYGSIWRFHCTWKPVKFVSYDT